MLLDGEAAPAGGIGIARQIKDDRDDAPAHLRRDRPGRRPLARRVRRRSTRTLVHPLDPVDTGSTVAELLPPHARPAAPGAGDRRPPACTRSEARHGRPDLAATCSTALLRGEELSTADTAWAMGEIMAGRRRRRRRSPVRDGAARQGRDPRRARRAGRDDARQRRPGGAARRACARTRVDVVGTGGDRAHTVNISTMAAIVVAGAGCTGGQARQPGGVLARAAPPTCWSTSASRSTSARTGWPAASPRPASASASRPGSTPACATPAVPRREMGVPTVFNFLGPLTNPARPRAGAVGCFDQRMAPVMAGGVRRARRLGAGDARRGRARRVQHRRADPGLGGRGRHGHAEPWSTRSTWACPARSAGDLRGGDVAFNAAAARRLFAGEAGPVRDAVLVNAAAALAAHGRLPTPTTLLPALRAGRPGRGRRLRRRHRLRVLRPQAEPPWTAAAA